MAKAKSFSFDYDGEEITVVYDGNLSYELYVNDVLNDRRGGLFSIPLIGGTRLRGEGSGGQYIEVFIRNVGIYYRIEVEYQGTLVATRNFI